MAAWGTFAAATLAFPGDLCAWVYPEHRDITLLAVQRLDPKQRAELDGLWAAARVGHEQRLCVSVVEPVQGLEPRCLDWAAWPAVSGDHSCSGAEMLDTVLDSNWIMKVAAVGALLREHLAGVKQSSWRPNILRGSDIQLQRADPFYATRAVSNSAHFLLARPSTETTGEAYLRLSLHQGSELNAVGTYALYHIAALRAATLLSSTEQKDLAQRAGLAKTALANEAFAVHFLEDTFAAGHVAGNWGAQAVRKGTHDFYNERGLEVLTWRNQAEVLEGDANMRPEDARRAADVVRASIGQVLETAARPHEPTPGTAQTVSGPEGFDVCRSGSMPALSTPPELALASNDVLQNVPAPALVEGPGALPRFRAELGPFVGVSAASQIAWIDSGFATSEKGSGVLAALQVGLRLGLGLEGVMDASGDGLAFLDFALRQDTASTMPFTDDPKLEQTGALTAAIPSRGGLAIRGRAPFWLIPGDLLLAGIFVAPFSRSTFERMAVTAGNGGLIPWQVGILTRVGRFQLILGREVGIVLYGFLSRRTRWLMPPAPGSSEARLVELRTLAIDLPVLEYRPFRSFSMDQASVLVLQLFFGFDVPRTPEVIAPVGAPAPDLQTVFNLGLRVAFDWRRYRL